MANAFNLTAVLNFSGPVNLKSVISRANKQLQAGLRANVNLTFSASANKNLATLNRNLQIVNKTLKEISVNAAAAGTALTAMGKALGIAMNKANSNAAKNVAGVGNAAKQATGFMFQLGQAAGLALKRFAGFTVATGIVFGFISALSNAVKEAIDFQAQMVRIAQVRGTVSAAIVGITQEVTRLSTSLGVSSASLINISLVLSQAGFSINEVKTSMETLAKTTLSPTFGKIENTVEGAIAAMKQFSLTTKDLESALSSVNAVSANFAVESDDIITAVRTAGGAFAAASGDMTKFTSALKLEKLNEFIALFTSVRSTTRESAEGIATGLRTVFTRIQRGSTILALKELNIDLQDTEGNFVGVFEAVKRLSEGLKSVDPRSAKFNLIVEELGGFRQVNKVIPLIQRFGDAQKALGVAQAGNTSLTKDAASAQEIWLVQITKVREEFLALIRDISNTSSFQTMIGLILKTTSGLIKLAESVKPILPLLLSFAAIKGFGAITQFGKGFFGGLKSNGNGTGAGGAVANAGVQNNGAAATGLNTTALRTLTAAVVALTGALKIFGTARFPGLKFANGGVVPGVGNTDSVQASLMPGEFVLRKSAVEAIGVDNLMHANRGGLVRLAGGSKKRFPSAKSRTNGGLAFEPTRDENGQIINRQAEGFNFGAVFLNPRNVTSDTHASITASQIAKAKGKGLKPRDIGMSPSSAIDANFFSRGAGKSEEVDIIVEKDIRDTIGSVAREIKGSFGVQSVGSTDSFNVKPFNFASIVGGVFEGAMSLMGAPYGENPDSQRTFDFPHGIGSLAAGSFASFPKGIPTDAKRTATRDAFTSLKKKAANFIAERIPVLRGADAQKKAIAKNAVKPRKTSLEAALASPSGSVFAANDLGKLKDLQADKGFSSNFEFTRRGGKTQLIRKNRGGLARFAEGGEVNALLTPGEFVFNPEAVNRIGVNKLSQMNSGKALPKFHNGGAVGGPMHFAGGGSVGGASNQAALAAFAGTGRQAKESLQEVAKEAKKLGLSLTQLQKALNRTATIGLKTGDANLGREAGLKYAKNESSFIGRRKNQFVDNKGLNTTSLAGLAFTLPALLTNNDPSQKQNTVGAGAGGALQGAVTGGLIGSAFGPVGAAIGAAFGAGVTAISSFNDAVKNNSMIDLNKATKDLELTFKNFELGSASGAELDAAIATVLATAQQNINNNKQSEVGFSFSGLEEFGRTALSAVGTLGELHTQIFGYHPEALKDLGGSDALFAERKKAEAAQNSQAGLDALDIVAKGKVAAILKNNTGKNQEADEAEISKLFNNASPDIDAKAKKEALQQALVTYRQGILAVSIDHTKTAFDNLGQRLAAAAIEVSVMKDALSITNAEIGNAVANLDSFGAAIPKVSAISPFAESNKKSPQIAEDFANFARTTGISGQLEEDLTTSLVGGAKLEESLNAVLLDALATLRGGGEVSANNIVTNLDAAGGFKDLPEQLRSDVRESVQRVIESRQGEGSNGGSASFTAQRLEGLLQKGTITNDLKISPEARAKAQELASAPLAEFNSQYESVLGTLVTATQKVNDSFDNLAISAEGNANIIKQARGGVLSVNELAAPEEAKIKAEAKRAGLTDISPAAIQARFNALSAQNESLTKRRAAITAGNALGGDDINSGVDLANQQADVINQLTSLGNTLNLSTKATTRLAAIQDKLVSIEQRKDAARGLGERLATAGPEEIFQINQELKAANALLQGAQLSGPQLAQGLNILKGILPTLSQNQQDDLNQRIGGFTANGLLKNVVNPRDVARSKIGDLNLIEAIRAGKGETAPEQDLIRDMNDIFAEQRKYQEIIANNQVIQLQAITKASEKSLDEIATTFVNAMKAALESKATTAPEKDRLPTPRADSLEQIADALLDIVKMGTGLGGARGGRATGGFIPGRFSGADKQTYRVTPGEFIVNRGAAMKHADVLHAINSGQAVGMANGGEVLSLEERNANRLRRAGYNPSAKRYISPGRQAELDRRRGVYNPDAEAHMSPGRRQMLERRRRSRLNNQKADRDVFFGPNEPINRGSINGVRTEDILGEKVKPVPNKARHPRNVAIDEARANKTSSINGISTDKVIKEIRDRKSSPITKEIINAAKDRNKKAYDNDPLRKELAAKVAAKQAERKAAANAKALEDAGWHTMGGGVFNVPPEQSIKPNVQVGRYELMGGMRIRLPDGSVLQGQVAEEYKAKYKAENTRKLPLLGKNNKGNAFQKVSDYNNRRGSSNYGTGLTSYKLRQTNPMSAEIYKSQQARMQANITESADRVKKIEQMGADIETGSLAKIKEYDALSEKRRQERQESDRILAERKAALPPTKSQIIEGSTFGQYYADRDALDNERARAKADKYFSEDYNPNRRGSSLANYRADRELLDKRRAELSQARKGARDPSNSAIAAQSRFFGGPNGYLADRAALDAKRAQGTERDRSIGSNSVQALYPRDASFQRVDSNPRRRRLTFATGGAVPGIGNHDTIPAVLTPGEFVVNKQATQANLAILQSMNRGRKPTGFKTGTQESPPFSAPSMGGGVPKEVGLNEASIAAFSGFGNAATAFAQAAPSLDRFTQAVTNLNNIATQLANMVIPNSIELQVAPLQVNVNINGAEALASMEGPIGDMVTARINEALNKNINLNGETNERFVV